jgi:hypothetical protein
LRCINPSSAQAVLDSLPWKAFVVFLPAEALFLGGSHNDAITHECSGAVMKEG